MGVAMPGITHTVLLLGGGERQWQYTVNSCQFTQLLLMKKEG